MQMCLLKPSSLAIRSEAAPAVLDRLNSLLEPNGFLLLTESGSERLVRPHEEFRLFFTMGTQGGTVSRAVRNRCLEIYMDTFLGGRADERALELAGSLSEM